VRIAAYMFAVADFTKTSGCAVSRNRSLDPVYEFLCFGEILPGEI